MFAFTHPLPPILAEELSSKLRFFIQNSLIFISSQTWDCDVLGSKKTAVNQLALDRGVAVPT